MYWVKFAALPLPFLFFLSLFFLFPITFFYFFKKDSNSKFYNHESLCALWQGGSEKPKRPVSAMFIFSEEKRKQLQEERPELSESELTRLLARMWNDLSEKKKVVWSIMHILLTIFLGEEVWGNMYSWVSQSQLELFWLTWVEPGSWSSPSPFKKRTETC